MVTIRDSKTLVFFLFVVVFNVIRVLAGPTFNVVDHGAVGDGKTNDTQVFMRVWAEACANTGSPTVVVPSGKTFLLGPVKFKGPCNSSIHVQVDGIIVAPNQVWKKSDVGHWITFNGIIGLAIDGTGQIDGNGAVWWKCRDDQDCSDAPDSLAIDRSKDVRLSGLKFINSPKKHVTIDTTVGAHMSRLTITAPGDSPNTDGVHIQESQRVQVMDSTIGTGDDCISIGTGTSDLNISGILCGPGHGISIGSLGKDGSEAAVERIHVSSCSLHDTTNGVRIKTWQGGSGYARGITFENIKFTSVERPIIIDQYYCDRHGQICPNMTSAVRVSDVHYADLVGSSVGNLTISLNCSESVACTGINMDNINIHPVAGGAAATFCYNAFGANKHNVIPALTCLT